MRWVVQAVACVVMTAPAAAQARREIVIEVPGERSLQNKLTVAGIGAAGILASALGVYWHLDSRDASDAVSADVPTGEPWSQEQIDLVDRADHSKTRATVAYAIGGALVIGAIATWILTEPASEQAVIRTTLMVAPVDGGTVVTRMWSF